MILNKEFVFLTMVAMEKEKKQFFIYHSNRCYEQKRCHQAIESYRFKLPLKKIGLIGSVQDQ